MEYYPNARECREIVSEMMDSYSVPVPIKDCYEKLGIFDWWKDDLSKRDLGDMLVFLNRAIENDFVGEVCFKVGIRGCANGMWADRADGYCLYRSFTPEYVEWSLMDPEKNFLMNGNSISFNRFPNLKKEAENKGWM